MNINTKPLSGKPIHTGIPTTRVKKDEPAETTPAAQSDSVEISSDAAGEASNDGSTTTRKHKISRMLRKGFLSAASTATAAFHSVLSIPVGIQMGLDTVKQMETERKAEEAGETKKAEQTEGKRSPEEMKRLNAARISTLASTAAAGAVGMAVLGPVGLVVGSVVGYLKGMVGNHLEAKSGISDQKMQKITSDVKATVGDSKGLWAKAKAMLRGATSGAVEGYKTRKTTSKIQYSGMLDGIGEAVDDWKASKGEPVKELSDQSEHNPLSKAAMTLSGGLFGAAGVMINAPGGMIIGTLDHSKRLQATFPLRWKRI